MNIYNAIMAAADSIEANAKLYDFWQSKVGECGTPACMFGWIGRHLRMPANTRNMEVARVLGLSHTTDLYDIIRVRFPGFKSYHHATSIAEGLRWFARTHLPSKPVEIPNWHAIAASPLIPEHLKSEELTS